MTTVESLDLGDAPRRPNALARPAAAVRSIPDVGSWAGITLIVTGFVLLAVCWGKVAGLTRVGLQLPYLASAGFTGLALVVTGLAVVSASARQKDTSLRRAQLAELAGTLRDMRALLVTTELASVDQEHVS